MNSDYRFSIIGKDGTQAMFRSIRTGLSGVRAGINSTQVKFAALAGVTGIGAVVNANRQAIDSLAKTSDKLGLTTEALAGLRHAADLTGNSQKNLDLGLQRMTRRIAEAAQGTGEATKALAELGLSAVELGKMTPDEQFRALAGAMGNVESQSDRVRLGFKLFDSEGVGLVNTLALGEEGLNKAAAEAGAFGLALTRVDAAKVEDANDQLTRVGAAVTGLGQKLTVKLAPMISVVSEKLIGAALEGDRMGEIITRGIGFAVKAVGVFANGLHGVKVIFAAVKLGADLFGAGVMTVFRTVVVGAVDAGNAIINFVLTPIRSALELSARFSDTAAEALASLNEMTTIETPAFIETIDGKLETLYGSITANREQLQALLMADLPAAAIEQRWAEIQAEAEQRAQDTVAAIEARLSGGEQGGGNAPLETDADRAKREAKEQREREQIAARLQRIDESYMTELQMLELKMQREYEVTAQARAQGLIEQEEYERRITEIKARGEKAQTDIKQKGEKARQAMMFASSGAMLGMVSGGSKQLFKIQKMHSLAQAAVAVPAAVTEAIKNGGGLPWGAVAGAMTLAQGVAQITAIKRQNFGGSGGGIPSISSSGAGSTAQATAIGKANGLRDQSIGSQFAQQPEQAAPQRHVNITIAGDVVGDTAETILAKMRTLIEENDAVLFSANSRQAAELAPAG